MHSSAIRNAKAFFDTYCPPFEGECASTKIRIVEIGSLDVNGSLRQICPPHVDYCGVDFTGGEGVDLVLESPYELPFEDETIDFVVSSSCFEHSEFFWISYLEILRILKPTGLFYLNAPSDGGVHRYPVDCWRFYPDSASALVNWANSHGLKPALLESFTQRGGRWQDFVAVFLKDSGRIGCYPRRILKTKRDFENGSIYGDNRLLNPQTYTQNERLIMRYQIHRFLNKIIPYRILGRLKGLTYR